MEVVRDDQDPGEVGQPVPDRRESAFNDPRFWVSVTAVLLTLSLAVFGFIATMLISISANIQNMALIGTQHTERITVLQRQIDEAKTDLKALEQDKVDRDKREADYRFAMGRLLTEINTTLKLKGDVP